VRYRKISKVKSEPGQAQSDKFAKPVEKQVSLPKKATPVDLKKTKS
jgi:hypothetical protein